MGLEGNASADGSRSVSDAVREAYEIYRIGSALEQAAEPVLPKNGARFHFELPGSVQGFEIDPDEYSATAVHLFNVEGESSLGTRTLAIQFEEPIQDRSVRVATRTFMSLEEAKETHVDVAETAGQKRSISRKAAEPVYSSLAVVTGAITLSLQLSHPGSPGRLD